jgi:hypothetical protein
MKIILLSTLLLIAGTALNSHAGEWVLEESTITYFVSHPLHHVEGISHGAKGKGECRDGLCGVLVAVPVITFDSGDSNRDLHMLQVTRAGKFPFVSVRTSVPENRFGATLTADLEIQFAGQTTHYMQVPFQRADQGDQSRIEGTIPLKISDFKIDPPMLLALPIKDSVPITINMTWRRGKP